MAEPRLEVLTEHLEQRLRGRRVVAGVFLTYAFEPGFFEQEVLPVVLGAPRSHATSIRRVQIEDALRERWRDLAVYYDPDALHVTDEGSAWQDVRRIPVRVHGGCFHPKNLFLLLQDADAPDRDGPTALMVACMSANLTKAGWWRNVEGAHFEEIPVGGRTRLRDDLLAYLRSVRALARSADPGEQTALQSVVKFLVGTVPLPQRSQKGVLHAHVYGGREDLLDWLAETAGERLHGACLEVLSPFVDDADESEPLESLVRRFGIVETRVLLPPSQEAGVAGCREALFDHVAGLLGVHWARLPNRPEFRTGKALAAEDRVIHAKVYRFFRPGEKRELTLVGSPNLTRQAHRQHGNVESAFLVESEVPGGAGFWLETIDKPPPSFRAQAERDESSGTAGSLLSVRFNWKGPEACAWWDGTKASPHLELDARGVEVFSLDALPARAWTTLPADVAQRLQSALVHTSLLTVREPGGRSSQLLVREDGMRDKPSSLLTLSVEDILRYWSLLTDAQRADLIETRMADLIAGSAGADVAVSLHRTGDEPGMFDRFAGIFQSFARMEAAVAAALAAGRSQDAECRLFGRKIDSLRTLLERLDTAGATYDPVHRYVIALCARQVLDQVRRNYPEFWQSFTVDVATLDESLGRAFAARVAIQAKNDTGMVDFLDWFEPWFLRRAQSPGAPA